MASAKNVSKYKEVPTLSFKKYTSGTELDRAVFIEALFDGLKYYGFIILKDHPVPTDLLDRAYSLVEKLFDLPNEVKNSYISPMGGGQRGFTPFGKEHAKNSDAPDLKEFWHVGRDIPRDHKFANSYPENIWPKEIPEFKTCFQEMYCALDKVSETLLEALTLPLELPKNYFREMNVDGNNILRLLHYPPLAEGANPKSIRAAAHEDINLLTILVAATTSGLELFDRDGKWLKVETDKNNLIVDAGDMMARLTNQVIPSTTHRVVNPQDGKNTRRFSMPYFIHPNPEAWLRCIPSCQNFSTPEPDILAQDFLMQRLREIGLM